MTKTATLGGLALLAVVAAAPAAAQAPVRLAYIDPLSGAFANVGDTGLKQFQYFAEQLNAKGGVLNGRKLEIVGFDNKQSAQETQIILKKVADAGIRFVTQGNGSNIAAAIIDAVGKHNEREPGKTILYLNYAAVDPAFTNDKCMFWHFRFDADADMKMEALADFMSGQSKIKKVYLINQDYSFGKAVAAAGNKMIKAKRPDVQIVGDELHPLGKVQDFAPYVAKIKASGADSVVTGNWGNDLALLVKAARDAGLAVDWYTYYGGGLGAVTAIGQSGKDHLKQITEWHANIPSPDMEAYASGFAKKYGQDYYYLRVKTMMEMFVKALNAAGSDDPTKVALALEGMKHQTPFGEVYIRKDNHQLIQPMFVSTLKSGTKYTIEGTDLGFVTDGRIEGKATETATTCKMKRPS